MRAVVVKERFLREERGFTLTEIMVTTLIMGAVLAALFNVFDMSLRLMSFGNNKVEAVESAREGLEKMEREIRGAYRFDTSTGKNYLFFTTATPPTALAVPPTTVTQLTFGNDLGPAVGPDQGNGKIECGDPCEYITYKLTDDTSTSACTAAPCTLRRVNTANSGDWGAPVVENVAVVEGVPGLTFQLLQSNGVTPATCEKNVGIVLVRLVVSVDKGVAGAAGTQTLTTVIDLRNRGQETC
jgi:prepilin-type N-terminal cleavage/methylation domain-containing protein